MSETQIGSALPEKMQASLCPSPSDSYQSCCYSCPRTSARQNFAQPADYCRLHSLQCLDPDYGVEREQVQLVVYACLAVSICYGSCTVRSRPVFYHRKQECGQCIGIDCAEGTSTSMSVAVGFYLQIKSCAKKVFCGPSILATG